MFNAELQLGSLIHTETYSYRELGSLSSSHSFPFLLISCHVYITGIREVGTRSYKDQGVRTVLRQADIRIVVQNSVQDLSTCSRYATKGAEISWPEPHVK
jgi:hypothetical protein